MSIEPNDAPEPARAANAANTIADPLAHPNAQAALRMARMGLPVFPCKGDKSPALNGWQAASSNDPAAVADLWRRFPGAPPGVDCAKAGLIVIDCDRHGGPDGVAAFNELVHGEIFPVTVQTPRNGMHVYFRRPDGFTPSNGTGDLPDGIDIRGNGYVISEGAVLSDGGRYTSEGFDVAKIGPLPYLILDRLRRPKGKPDAPGMPAAGANVTPFPRRSLAIGDGWDHGEGVGVGRRERAYAEEALRGCADDLKRAANGTRNATLNAVAFRMGTLIGAGWIDKGPVVAALTQAAGANGLTADDGARQVFATLNSGLTAGFAKPHPPLDERPANPAPPASVSKPSPMPGGLRLLTPTDAANAPPRQYIVKGLLGAGEFSILFGEPGCGKSFLATDLAYAIAQGRPWFGKKVRQGAVIYCGLEGGSGIAKRVRALLANRGDAPGFYFIARPMPLIDDDAVSDLIAAAKNVGASLIIVDTLARAMAGGDENSSEAMGAIIRAFDRIREETGAHLLAVHHSGKDAARGSRGHSSLKGAADAELEVTKGDAGIRIARVTKSKDDADGDHFTFALDVHELGTDQDGDPVTTCLVREFEAEENAHARRPNVAAKLQGIYREIVDVFASPAIVQSVQPKPDMPFVMAVSRDQVREALRAAGRFSLDEKGNLTVTDRSNLSKWLAALRDSSAIYMSEKWVWLPN